jgi:hypothetical protein
MNLSEIFPEPTPSIGVGTMLRNSKGDTFLVADGGNAIGLVNVITGLPLKPLLGSPTSRTRLTREEVVKLISGSGLPQLAEWDVVTLNLNA